jgi:hypothetical protein
MRPGVAAVEATSVSNGERGSGERNGDVRRLPDVLSTPQASMQASIRQRPTSRCMLLLRARGECEL